MILSLTFWAVAAICNAVMDKLAHHHSNSVFHKARVFSFFGADSWLRKYKDFNPAAGPRFWGSTTFLVFLTDGWHFFQWLMLTFVALSVLFFDSALVPSIEHGIAIFLIYRVGWGLMFELWYAVILQKWS